MQFEWNEDKNRANKRKHGISFEAAALVFRDPYLLSVPDERFRYNEERWQNIGLVNDVALYVANTVREANHGKEEIIRIISARAATPREEREYYAHRRTFKRN